MSGTGTIGSPSYMPALYGVGARGDSLLETLYGRNGRGQDAVNPIAALDQARRAETRQVALTAARPEIKRDLARFAQALAKAKTPAELLGNPTALKVLLTANGLGDQTANRALAAKALLSDTSKPGSLAARLSDTRWKPVTETYAFATKGLSVLKDPKVIDTITKGYAEVLWRQNLDQTTPGLSRALDFMKRASTITSALQVLGDPIFRAVITTALSVPREIAFQSLSAQETAITQRLDIAKFKDPAFVNQFTHRYLIAAANDASLSGANGEADFTSLAVRSAGLVV